MHGNYLHYFVMFTLSQAYEILSCDILENATVPASASLRPPGGRGALGKTQSNAIRNVDFLLVINFLANVIFSISL